MPSRPSVMISPGPCGQSVATTGTPQCMASTMVMPKDSMSEETAATAPLAHSVSIGETAPMRKTRSCSPSRSICSRRFSFCGPRP